MKIFYKFENVLETIIDKLEKRFGKCAIPNITLYIVTLNALCYMLITQRPSFINFLTLNVDKIFKGQIWRIFTYLFIPPMTNFIFIFFALYFLYLIGSGLEAEWGSFRLNLYYLVGMVSITFVSFLFPNVNITNAYLNISLFLAFATIYPDFTVLLFFILPVKVKWLAWISCFFMVLSIINGTFVSAVFIFVSLLNYFIFLGPKLLAKISLRINTKVTDVPLKTKQNKPFHQCSVCESNDINNPEMTFRVCPICEKDFCSLHIDNHRH